MQRFLGGLLVIACLFVLVGCQDSTQAGRKRIVVDSFMLEDFCDDLIGGEAEVEFASPEGVDLHDWKPTPNDISRLQSAHLILINGGDVSEWVESASLPQGRVKNTCAEVADKMIELDAHTHEHGKGEPHSHGVAGHTSFDREIVLAQLEATASALKKLLPSLRETIEQNHEELLQRLDVHFDNLDSNCGHLKNQRFVATKKVYQYLARAGNLNMTYVELDPMKIPSAEQLAELKKVDPDILFWHKKPSDEADKAVKDLNIYTYVLKPLSEPQSEDFWSTELQKDVEILKKIVLDYKNNDKKLKNPPADKPKADDEKAESKDAEEAKGKENADK